MTTVNGNASGSAFDGNVASASLNGNDHPASRSEAVGAAVAPIAEAHKVVQHAKEVIEASHAEPEVKQAVEADLDDIERLVLSDDPEHVSVFTGRSMSSH